MKKIAIDVSQLVYSGTGVGRYVAGLTKALLEANSDYHFIFYAGALRQFKYLHDLSLTSPFRNADWKLYPLPPKASSIVFNNLGLSIDPFIGKVDLLHTSDWTEPTSKYPKVTTVHDLVFKKYSSTVDPLILSTQTQRLKRVVAEGTHIIADSHSTKQDLMDLYSISGEKIDVVYPGIGSEFKPVKSSKIEQVKKKYNLPETYLLTLGTKEPRKNLALLAEVIADSHHNLVVTGRHGWGDKLHTGSNITETGFIEDRDLPALYSGASAFVYPSLYEGFGFPIGEAMACGVPVVTSNVSSLPEVAGIAGILVDPLSGESIRGGIERALKDASSLSKQSLKQASKFTWEKTALDTIKVYNKLLAGDN